MNRRLTLAGLLALIFAGRLLGQATTPAPSANKTAINSKSTDREVYTTGKAPEVVSPTVQPPPKPIVQPAISPSTKPERTDREVYATPKVPEVDGTQEKPCIGQSITRAIFHPFGSNNKEPICVSPPDCIRCKAQINQAAVAPAELPPWLPRYKLNLQLDPKCNKVTAHEVVTWTNRSGKPEKELRFHVYPRHKPDKGELEVYQRTMESFRVDPREGVEKQGRRLQVHSVKCGPETLPTRYDEKLDTVLIVALPEAVAPGATVEVSLDFELELPNVQGRFGHFNGIYYMLNWYPILAYHSDKGWDAPPFVGWHQPWFNEAGNYDVTIQVPRNFEVASSGQIVERVCDGATQTLRLIGHGIRDFSIVTSSTFEATETDVDGVTIRVLATPKHRFYARQALAIATECMRLYTHWFGPYPHPQFTIAESYFGWNGNETSAMVLIDARVFDAPTLGQVYFDNLISHEICHQWWYATVGTDGYRETWMDEGLVTYFTQVRMTQKYGSDIKLFQVPKYMNWFPNIRYHDLQHNGYFLYRWRGGNGTVVESLTDLKHVYNLFFLVYDRGSKVVGMIHRRMGDDDFFGFMRMVYAKYRYRILFVNDYQRELEEYTGQSWQQFFDDWLRSPKVTDWKVASVQCKPCQAGYNAVARIVQKGQIDEPVEIVCRTKEDGPLSSRITLFPGAGDYEQGSATIHRVGPHEWDVCFKTLDRPRQIEVDPDDDLVDADPTNNRWKWDPAVRLTPIYTPIDESPLVHPADRASIVAGPNVDIEGRVGLRASLIHSNRYRVSPFLAYDGNDAQWTVGVDSEFFNIPAANLSIGVRYDHTLTSALFDDPHDQGRLYMRWYQAYTTSLLYPHNAYVEGYFRFGDNFYPDEDFRPPTTPGVEDYRHIRAVGVAWHVDTLMPYWNPETGYRFDVTYENGFKAAGAGESYNRIWSQAAATRKLPDGLGYFSDTRFIGRVAGGFGSPDNGEHFRFGGPMRFRGERSEDTEGSAFWLASLDWRFPLCREIDFRIVDNIVNWKALYAGVFYDVGESYLFDRSQGVDHALGVGLYFQFALFSFIENVTLRMEYAHSLASQSNVAWFGMYYAF